MLSPSRAKAIDISLLVKANESRRATRHVLQTNRLLAIYPWSRPGANVPEISWTLRALSNSVRYVIHCVLHRCVSGGY